ncbi:hypothetical protein [Celeribacter sp. SCSIO 80788]|uniref:hypothetical protein n=1 Tax=Celeribacter sp. SCSIO 80788 TaxID=3117013 RepID=UPI003DA6B2F5
MKRSQTTLLTFGAALLCATSAYAFQPDMSYVGLSYTGVDARDPGDSYDYDGGRVTIDAGTRLSFGAKSHVVIDGFYTGFDVDDAFGSYYGPEKGGEIALHYLYDLSPKFTVGGLFAYGMIDQKEDGYDTESMDYTMYGLEGVFDLSPKVALYGQLVATENPGYNDSYWGGMNNGYVARLGGVYDLNASTSLYLDLQYAESEGYEDSDEDGTFNRYAIGGETAFSSKPLAVTYEIAYMTTEAKGDNNDIESTEFSLGLRYYFGGKGLSETVRSGMLGTPETAFLATSWAPYHD